MVKEKVYERIFNYINGISWSKNNIYVNLKEENIVDTINAYECLEYDSFVDLNSNDWTSRITKDEIIDLYNDFYSTCIKSDLVFSSTITSKVRIIEWQEEKKKKLEKEEIIRLSINSNSKDYSIIDIPIERTRKNIIQEIQKSFYTIYNKENNCRKVQIRDKVIDIILSPNAAGYFIHEIIGHPLEIDFIKNSQSIYTVDDLGKQIMPDFINVSDHPDKLKSNGIEFGSIDDSGNELYEKEVIVNGVLKSFIDFQRCDQLSNICINRMYNLQLKPNRHTKTLEDIINASDNTLIVDNIICGFYNCVTKKYTLHCGRCRFIEKGSVSGYIDNITIEDDLFSVQNKIVEIGSDFCESLGKCNKQGQIITVGMGSPSIKLMNVEIRVGV